MAEHTERNYTWRIKMARKKGMAFAKTGKTYQKKVNKTLKQLKDTLGYPFKLAAKGHKEKSTIWSLLLYIGAILSFPVSLAIAGFILGFEFGKELILMPIRTIRGAVDEIKGYL
jgi:hypothetical protein